MKTLALVLILALSPIAHASKFKELPWKEFGTATLVHGKLATVEMHGATGMYLRFFVPEHCGYTTFGVVATGQPFDPSIVYAENYSTPEGRTLYFFVKEERDIAFAKIWLQNGKVGKGRTCPITLSLAPAPAACGLGDSVFAQGFATSNVAEYVARELAWNRTLTHAQRLCHGARACKVPGKSKCSGTGHGNHWRFECNGWFICEQN